MISSKTPSSATLFESISLSVPERATEGESSMANTIPESASATSDDDNIDPIEFISADQDDSVTHIEQTAEREGITGRTKTFVAPAIPEEEFFSNPSRMQSESSFLQDSTSLNQTYTGINSEIQGPVYSLNQTKASNEEPIKFLTKKTDILMKELHNNIQGQKKALVTGAPELNKYRSMISQNFDQLSEAYYSLNELYFQETAYLESVDAGFRNWDARRNKIFSKITSIKSDKNKNGKKLARLIDEDQSIDSEIQLLEDRLKNLKNKKKLIRQEMETTSSILESKAFKFVEFYKESERDGNEMIKLFLKRSNVPTNEMKNILKFKPISVDFQPSSSFSVISSDTSIRRSVVRNECTLKEGDKANNDRDTKPNSIGMQPYVYPETSTPADTPRDRGDSPDYNNNNAFEKGYREGSKGSEYLRSHVGGFLKSILEPPDNKNKMSMSGLRGADVMSNKIGKRIDIEPTLALVKYKIAALKHTNISSSSKAQRFHEYAAIWKEVLHVLRNHEAEIASLITNLGLDNAKVGLSRSLSSGFDQLAGIIENCSRFFSSADQNSIEETQLFNLALSNEIYALISAVKMIEKKEELGIEQHERFKKLGLFLIKEEEEEEDTNTERDKTQGFDKDLGVSPLMYNDAQRKSFPSISTSNLQHISSEDFIPPMVSNGKTQNVKHDLKNIFHEFATAKQMKRE